MRQLPLNLVAYRVKSSCPRLFILHAPLILQVALQDASAHEAGAVSQTAKAYRPTLRHSVVISNNKTRLYPYASWQSPASRRNRSGRSAQTRTRRTAYSPDGARCLYRRRSVFRFGQGHRNGRPGDHDVLHSGRSGDPGDHARPRRDGRAQPGGRFVQPLCARLPRAVGGFSHRLELLVPVAGDLRRGNHCRRRVHGHLVSRCAALDLGPRGADQHGLDQPDRGESLR